MPLNPEQIEAMYSIPAMQMSLKAVIGKGIPLMDLAEGIVAGQLPNHTEALSEILAVPYMQQLIFLATVDRMRVGQEKLFEAVAEFTEAVQALRADVAKGRPAPPAPKVAPRRL